MAATTTIYNSLFGYILDGTVDIMTDDIMVALVSSAYTPDAEHDEWADASGSEITGTGYTAGGASLSGKAVSRTGAAAKFTADSTVFAGLSATFRRAILYAAVTRNGKTNPLIAHVLIDSTPADVTVAGIDYAVAWPSTGILTLQPVA